jgi:hypothetical protein
MKARPNIRARGVGCILAAPLNNSGRPEVSLYDPDGNFHHGLVHQLVAEAFVPNPDRKPWVCHRDGDPLNNHHSNLYWGTASENAQDKVRHGRQPSTARGRKSRVSMEQAREIRAKYTGAWGEQTRLAAEYGMTPSNMWCLLAGKTYVEAV